MCYSPITIVNPTRYVSLKYRDRFLLQVSCGKCAQCQQRKSNEYYYRAYYQAMDCIENGGFVLFDTLTYNNQSLPHIDDYVDTKFHFPCFNSKHVRNFVKKLRQRCLRWFDGANFTYYLTSEYGTSEKHMHRPHYHVLFFVSGNIKPLEFSKLVAETWEYGRTDGFPYKSAGYVLNNVLNGDLAKSLRILKYISKYISKNCIFQKQIDKRVTAIMFDIAKRMPEGWLNSLNSDLYRERLLRHIGQFHRQSTHFGESALASLDLNQVMQDGQLSVVDNKHVVLSIPLPTYYKRKLFYKQVIVDKSLLWTPTEFGYEYLEKRNRQLKHDMKNKFQVAALHAGVSVDLDKLVDYVCDFRGRIKAKLSESTLDQRLSSIDLYKYATRYDRLHLDKLGLYQKFLGNSYLGYSTKKLPSISLFSFGRTFSYYDDEKEKVLHELFNQMSKINDGRQSAYQLRQRLTNLFHHLSSSPL